MRKVKVEEISVDNDTQQVNKYQYISSTTLLTKYDKVSVIFPKMIEDARDPKDTPKGTKKTANDWSKLMSIEP